VEKFVELTDWVRDRPDGWAGGEQVARMILEQRGFPTIHGMYSISAGQWVRWDQSDDWFKQEVRFSAGNNDMWLFEKVRKPPPAGFRSLETWVLQTFDFESDEHFSVRILERAQKIAVAREAELTKLVEHLAFLLRTDIMKWLMKRKAEPLWHIGERVVSGGRKGADTAHREPVTRQTRRARVMEAVQQGLSAGLSLTEARRSAANGLGVSYSTVRREQKRAQTSQ
jgi:hypothetical protein